MIPFATDENVLNKIDNDEWIFWLCPYQLIPLQINGLTKNSNWLKIWFLTGPSTTRDNFSVYDRAPISVASHFQTTHQFSDISAPTAISRCPFLLLCSVTLVTLGLLCKAALLTGNVCLLLILVIQNNYSSYLRHEAPSKPKNWICSRHVSGRYDSTRILIESPIVNENGLIKNMSLQKPTIVGTRVKFSGSRDTWEKKNCADTIGDHANKAFNDRANKARLLTDKDHNGGINACKSNQCWR